MFDRCRAVSMEATVEDSGAKKNEGLCLENLS